MSSNDLNPSIVLIFLLIALYSIQHPQIQLFPGMWFSHAGQLVSVQLVVQPSSMSSMARFHILRPYCSPNQHLVPPGDSCQGIQKACFCLSHTGNNPLFALQVAALSLIHSATAHHSRYVTPQGAVAWASTGVT